MIVTFAMLVTLTAVCSTALNTDQDLEEQEYEYGLTIVDSFTDTRRKRSVISLGTSALKALLSKTTRLTNTRYQRNYYRNHMKYGDTETALKDFESVNPVSVRTRTTDNGVKVISGVVEGKILKIRIPGYKFNSEAVLDIIDKSNRIQGTQYVDSIIYSKKALREK